jgi:hypothetical protein
LLWLKNSLAAFGVGAYLGAFCYLSLDNSTFIS